MIWSGALSCPRACSVGNTEGKFIFMGYGGSRDVLPQDSGGEVGEEAVDEGSSRVNEQASFAVNKLRELNEKLEYKRQALNSIQNAPKPDKKVTLPFSRLSVKVAIFLI